MGNDMDNEERDVPDGVALFPHIPPELGVHPLLLVALHSVVFLEGSDDEIVQPDAADECLEYIADYMQRLSGRELQRVQEDLETLRGFGRQEKWPKAVLQFLKDILKEYGVTGGDE